MNVETVEMEIEGMPEPTVAAAMAQALEPRSGLYLPPSALTASEANAKARPGEKAEERKVRVEALARSIAAQGQLQPVLVVEQISDEFFDEDGLPAKQYQYVDGGARVEAIASLNAWHREHDPLTNWDVWCSIVDPASDLFRTAVTSNLHRTGNSILQMAEIIREVRERNNWKGRGGQQKVCEYLGLTQTRISDYERVLRAPKAVRELIDSGEVTTVDAALRLIATPQDELPQVTERAREIAAKDVIEAIRAKEPKPKAPVVSGRYHDQIERTVEQMLEPLPDVDRHVQAELDRADGVKAKATKPKVTAKHVAQAAREVSSAKTPLSRAELIQAFDELRGLPYPPSAKEFIVYFVDTYAKGAGDDKTFGKKFDHAVMVDFDQSQSIGTDITKDTLKPAKTGTGGKTKSKHNAEKKAGKPATAKKAPAKPKKPKPAAAAKTTKKKRKAA